MIDAFNFAASQPWAIEPAALQNLLTIAARLGDPAALANRSSAPLPNSKRADYRSGTAIIPVTGPIFRHAGLLTEISGATATGTLAKDFQTALDNTAVHTILLSIDSPGGEANGIKEMSDMIYAARAQKNIVAYIGGTGASAAYWIASAASKVIVDETAVVGSIGVVMSNVDTTARDEKAGIRRTDIVSSASPDKRVDTSTDAGRAKIQSLVDALGDIFVRDVARNRGTSKANVLANYGKGFVMTGGEAVRAGMADGIGSFEGTLAGRTTSAAMPAVRADTRADIAAGWARAAARVSNITAATPEQDNIEPANAPTSKYGWDAVVANARERAATAQGVKPKLAHGWDRVVARLAGKPTDVPQNT
jgi:signal peptide peptidase SppA